MNREQVSRQSFFLYLQFPNPEWISGVWPGGELTFHANIDGNFDGKL